MTLSEFIATKPACLRLGQHFVNTYWKGTDEHSQTLYQLDGSYAVDYIKQLMEMWHWDYLPELES